MSTASLRNQVKKIYGILRRVVKMSQKLEVIAEGTSNPKLIMHSSFFLFLTFLVANFKQKCLYRIALNGVIYRIV
jgi:hypothetical protein